MTIAVACDFFHSQKAFYIFKPNLRLLTTRMLRLRTVDFLTMVSNRANCLGAVQRL
jgi:hypothetical protein